MTTLSAIGLMFRGFADRTRLRILHLLSHEGEMCVGDLVASLRVPQPTASRGRPSDPARVPSRMLRRRTGAEGRPQPRQIGADEGRLLPVTVG